MAGWQRTANTPRVAVRSARATYRNARSPALQTVAMADRSGTPQVRQSASLGNNIDCFQAGWIYPHGSSCTGYLL